ncbi:hypothetical protein HYU17_01475 [Candidatus Woesearchaeota archaeon]|nr:hypothetical protein [Candidatus Woesearchaeota archaeon]
MKKELVIMLFLAVALLPVAASAWPVAVPASSAENRPDDYKPQVPAAVNSPGNPAGNDSAGASAGGNAVPFNPPSGYKPFKAAQPNTGGSDGSGPAGPVSSAEVKSSKKAIGQESLTSIPQTAAAQPEASVVPEQVAGETPQKVEASGGGSAAVPSGNVKAESQQNKEEQQKSMAKPPALVRIARFFKRLFG